VLRAFRAELGEERANRIAWQALAQWRTQVLGETLPLPGRSAVERFRAGNSAMTPIIGDAVDVHMLKDNPDVIEFNVTGCRFAQFFRDLGEPELGFALTCAWDDTTVGQIGVWRD
jgi:L-2-amino-thiazoline-4-carboxylic acid hydrolase